MRTVSLRYHRGDNAWWADSDDMPGFSAAADTFNAIRKEAWDGVRFYFDDQYATNIKEYTEDGAQVLSSNIIVFDPQPLDTFTGPYETRSLTSLSASHDTRKRIKLTEKEMVA